MKRKSLIIIILIALVLTSFLFIYRNSSQNSENMITLSPMSASIQSYGMAASTPAGAAVGAVPASSDTAAIAPAAPASQSGASNIQRRVIGKASIELIVLDVEAVIKQINQLMTASHGYVANANLQRSNYNGSEQLQGTLQLRIPADQLDTTLSKLEAMGIKARAKTLNREDVTDQYSDIDAQLRNLQATETELRQLLTEVRERPNATPEDILTVHRNLTEIRSQIDQLQGRKNMLDNLIALSTIDVTLTPDIVSQPVIEAGWQPLAVVRASLRNLVGTLQSLTDAGIWLLLYFLPVLLILCIPVAIMWLIVRTLVRWWQRRSVTASAQG